MKISIVTPSFNQGEFIERTIKSVLGQKGEDIELIVIDGGSTDGTVEILKEYGDKIKWISEKDGGQTGAINKGMGMATGDVMAYLNSDDTYEPGTLSAVAKYFEENPETFIVYGRGRHIDEMDSYMNDYPTDIVDREILRRKCPICQPTVFWRRELWKKIGEFDETLSFGMDYDYWIRVSAEYKFGFINQYLANTRLHQGAKTVAQQLRVAEEMIKINLKNYGKTDDIWILNYVGEKINQQKLKWIVESFWLVLKTNRRLPAWTTWRVYLTWIKEWMS